MKLKKVIKELAEGKIVIENDLPDTKLLVKILKKAFPLDGYNYKAGIISFLKLKYFYQCLVNNTHWDSNAEPQINLPIVKLSTIQPKSKNDVIEKMSQLEKSFKETSAHYHELSLSYGNNIENFDQRIKVIEQQLTPKECPRNIECDFEKVEPSEPEESLLDKGIEQPNVEVIDWETPQLLISKEYDCIVSTNGKTYRENFEAVVVVPSTNQANVLNQNDFVQCFGKRFFKKFNGIMSFSKNL